jgi:hypothetical protein
MARDELTWEMLDAVDAIMDRPDAEGIDRGKLERLLSHAWLDGRKSGLEAAQQVYSPDAS